MDELPAQVLLQQQNARPVSGEELEVFGKKAAAMYLSGECETLNDAVINTVKLAQLSPEQVRRVVEFTNVSAYNEEFKKEGAHKIITFEGGPADPSFVLKDLNDGGGGTVFDRGTLDYGFSPESAHKMASARGYSSEEAMDKTASVQTEEVFDPYEEAFWGQFGLNPAEEQKLAYAEPYQPLVDLHRQCLGLREKLAADLNSCEFDHEFTTEQLYQTVKQAHMNGVSFGDIVYSWSSVSEEPAYFKVAFAAITPRLQKEGALKSLDEFGQSLTKTGSIIRAVNPEHPLVRTFVDFKESFDKLASARAVYAEVEQATNVGDQLMKEAAQGALGKALGRLQGVTGAAGSGTEKAMKFLSGDPDLARTAGNVVDKSLYYGTLGTGALAANAGVQEITDRPAVSGALGAYKSLVPGTQEYNMRRYRTMSGQ